MRSFGKFKIRFFSFVLFISVLFSFLITSSCEIGLGAAVDTMVPTISIDSPAADSTIRDSFAFRGTWSDDGAIMGLTVTLNTIEGDTVGQPALTKSGTVNYAAVIGQSNTWECTIEPGAEELKDGKYEATVTITDMAGHATSVNRQITVDNTAPVVVLQRPGTDLEAAVSEMDSYGQTLSLEGQAADDSSISHIDVKVYADSKLTQLLDTVTLTNVPPTISLDVAKFGEIDYTKIYGSSEKQGTKYFWCEIEAYDSAERYPADGSEQSEEDKNGNCEKTYYLYEDIATSVLSQYKITELYKIKSGTWKDSAERSAEGISAILSEKVKSGGSFSLNPDNSPTFRVISGGLEGLRGGEENFSNGKNSITNGGELAIEVNPGLDNIPLAAGLKVYAVECDGNGNALEGAVKLYPAGADSATKSGTKYTINPVFNQSTGSDGTGGFVFNHTYLLGVEGADESGNAIVAKEGAYGFIFTSSGARPAVTVVTPDENEHFIAKDGTQTVSGSVSVEEGVAALEIKVYRAGDEANAVTVSDSAESASHALYQSVNENGTNSFNYVINCGAAPFSQTESGNYVIKVRASQGAKETVVTRSISYDVKGPEVKRISCEPVIKANDNSDTGKKNGTISVTGEFSDDKSGFENGSWKVYKAAETGAVNASTAGSFTWQEVSGLAGSLGAEEFNFNVNTRDVETSESVMRGMKLEFTATDAAGNTKRTEYIYTVDQSTDIPTASTSEDANGFRKLDLALKYTKENPTDTQEPDGLRQEVGKSADARKNVYTTGGQLVMSVKDDDGIASVRVITIKNTTEGSSTFSPDIDPDTRYSPNGTETQNNTYTYSGETSISVNHDLPQESGSYCVIVTITDTAGVTATGSKEYTFYVQVTGPAPDATVSGSPEWITTNEVSGLAIDSVRGLPKTKFNVSVNVTDGSERVDGGPKFLVKRSGLAGDTWIESGSVQLETDTSDSSGKKYKEGAAGYVPAAGTTKILYRVIDLFNNYKDIAFNYKIDNTAPGVEFTSSVPTTSDTENASFTFRGAASDTESGVSKVEISFDDEANWEAVSGTTGWNYNAVFADKYTSEGQKTVKVRSVDEVGNRSAVVSQSFMYDKAKPALGAIEYKRNGESSWSAAGNSFSTGNPFELKGTATDTNGVARVEISEYQGTTLKHTYTLTPSSATTSYEWSQPDLPYTRGSGNALVTGSYTYKVKVYDVSDATNPKTEEKTFTLNIDLDAPEVSAVNGLSAGTNLSILDAATYAFSGKVKDLPAADAEGNTPATGVESMEYVITDFYGSDGTTEITTVPGGTTWTNIDKSTNGASEEDWNTAPWTLNTGNSSAAAAFSLNEGKYKIWIRAKDKAGNAGTAVSRAFYVDKAAPVLSFAAADSTAEGNGYLNKSSLTGTSGSLNLNGQAVETNGFEYLRYKKNSETPVDLTTDESGNWTLGFTYGSGSGSSYLADGTYTFTVEARDKAGREGNTITRSWTIDTKEPTVGTATSGLESDGVTKKEITAGRWFKSRTVSIEVPAADNAATGGQASGISLVEWSVDGTNWNAITKDANADIYKGPVEFTGTGAQTLYIRATDKAGNETFWPSSSGISVNIDETAPLLEKTKYQVAGNAVSEEDSVYINGTKALTVYGTYSDSESGVKALSVKKSDGASTFTALECTVTYTTAETPSETSNYAAYDTISNKKTITGWKCEITAAALDAAFPAAVNGNRASIKLRFDGENMADATTTLVAYSLIWDSTLPTIPANAIILKQKTAEETSYTDDVYKKDGVYYLNPTGKTLYVSGSASDKSGLASVTAAMGGESGELTQATGFSNEAWAFTGFNGFVAADADNTEKTITITAVDKAGNSNTQTLTLRSDKTGPAGIHLIDDSGKDIFFRVGNYNADTNEGISSDTASNTATNVWSAGAKYNATVDSDVGGKYSGGTFGNAMTVTVRGLYEDVVNGTDDPLATTAVKGSGLKMIYYKVYPTQPTLTGTALIEDVVDARHKISPKEDTKRVFYKDSSSTAAGNEFTGYNTYVEGTDAGTSGASSVSEEGAHVSVTSEGYIGKVGGKNRDRNWTTVKTSFCETLSGFGEGANYFVLVAEDNAGNRSVDTVRNVATTTTTAGVTTTTYNTYPNYMLNVDTQVPEITSGTNETVYTNLTDPLEIELTAKDVAKEEGKDPAGISSVLIEVGSRTIKEEDTVTTYGKVEYLTAAGGTVVTAKPDDAEGTETDGRKNKTAYRKVTLNPAAFTGLSGNITVYATVTDNAGTGNSQRVSVATVNVDRVAPDVTINDIVNADADDTEHTNINGKITVSGTAADNNGLGKKTTDRIRLYYITAASTISTDATSGKVTSVTGWSEYENLTQNSSWSLLVDTTATAKFTDKTEYWICASATDKAGNTGYSVPKKVYVNQDSDRPKIKFSNVTLGASMSSSGHVWLKNTTELVGTVSDDDGVDSMQISLTGADTDWHNVTVNGSSFRYDLRKFYIDENTPEDELEAALEEAAEPANGPKTVYFKVTDTAVEGTTAAPKTFTSKATAEGDAVFLVDGANKYGGSGHTDSRLYVKVDTIYPQVILGGAKFTGATGDFGTNYSAIKLGGTNTSFVVKFTASDTNGINNSTVCGTAEFPYGSGSDKVTVNSGTLTTPSETDNYYTLTFTLTEANVNLLKAAHTEEGNTVEGYDGAVNVRISAKDNAGNETPQTATLSYDFKKASITFGNPDSSVTSSGAVDAYGNLSETCSGVYYTVAPRAMTADEKAGGTIGTAANWTDGDGHETDFDPAKAIESWQAISDATGLSWTVKFDNATGTNGTHGKSMNKYIIDYGIASQDSSNMNAVDAIVSSFDTIVKLYMWVKSVDHAGNVSYEDHLIQVDPQGDRPTLQITTPSANNGTMGGKVSIFGTATDTKTSGSDTSKIGVDSVWVQIKSTTHGSDTTTNYGTAPSYDASTGSISMSLTKKDLEYMASMKDSAGNNYHVYKMDTYNAVTGSGTEWTSCSTDADAKDYAILASLSGAAWELEINSRGELDPPSSTDTSTTSVNPVAIRVMARDKDNKFSTKADRYVKFDADTPQIKDLKLVQSASADISAAATAEKPYSSENFVKGVWYVTGTAEDKDEINTLVIGTDTLVQNGSVTAAWAGKVKIYTKDNSGNLVDVTNDLPDPTILRTTVKFKYALDTGSGYGTAVKVIAATDKASGSPHTGNATVSVKYDNENPVLATTAAQGFNIAASVQQNNSWYTFGSKAFENSTSNDENVSQSGFAYTAFYFVRNNTIASTKTLYDVLRARNAAAINITGDKFYTGTTDTTGTAIAALGSETSTADNTIVTDSGLYWYRKGISSVSGNTITLNDASGIRGSSLIKIKGVIYLVESVSGNSVTLTTQPPADASVAYAAIAGVVNNTVVEGEGTEISETDGYYDAPSRDDGDRMMESVYKSGTAWEWEAKICSRNIPDGPVKLHYVVFDKAGNYTAAEVDATVSNNRPRMAGVTVKTDYNGDGDYTDEGETINNYSTTLSYSEYYTGTDGSGKKVYDPDKRVYGTAAKNPLPVSMECGSVTNPVASLRGKTVIQPEIVGGNGSIYYSYKVTNGTNVKSGNNNTAFMTGSLDYTAVTGNINVHVGDLLSFNDTVNAATGIPFEFKFWDSTEGTQAFSTTAPSQTAELKMYFAVQAQTVGTPVVKVTPFYWESITSNSVEKTASPKKYTDLQGHIELEEDLAFTGNTFISTSGLMDRDAKVSGKIILEGTAHDNNLIDTITASIFGTTKTLAHYDSGHLVSNKTAYDAEGWYFEVVTDRTGKNGHDVTWKLHIDTQILGVAGLDKTVTVTATNKGKPSYGTGSVIGISGTAGYAATPSYTEAASNSHEGESSTARGQTTWAVAKASWEENKVYTDTAFKKAVQKRIDAESGNAVYYILDANGNEQAMADTAVVYISTARTAKYQMDIVPYIREVKTSLSEVNTDNPTVYSRTALGHYPVYVTFAGGETDSTTAYNNRLREDISLEGFNLAGCSLNFENDDPNTLKGVTGALVGATATASLDANGKYKIPTGAGSGHVYVQKNIGTDAAPVYVSSLNNVNNDDAKGGSANVPANATVGDSDAYADFYNRQPNGTNNNRLTDDVYIDIWEFNRQAAKAYNDGNIDYLEMKINPNNGMLGFAFTNGNTRFAMPKADNSYQQWNRTYDYMRYNALAYDVKGQSYAVSVGGDISSGGAADVFSVMSSRWGFVGSSQDSNKGNGNLRKIESIGQRQEGSATNLNNNTKWDFRKKNRFQSQSIATREHTHNTTSYTDVFIAYYDLGNDEIRLKMGTINGGTNNYGQIVDRGNGKNGANHAYSEQLPYVLVLAKTANTTDTLGTAGKYVSVGVTQKTQKPVVVVTWYDGSDLQFAWAEYNYANNNTLQTVSGLCGNQTTVTWHSSTIMQGAGEYCQLVVDSDDKIHIAAYDGENLKYAYLNGYNATPIVATVDSSAGSNLTIDVAKVGNNQIPYIGYTSTEPEQPRYAYLASIPKKDDGTEKAQSAWTSGDIAGVGSGNTYTGVWECTVVPTIGVDDTGASLGTKMITDKEISVAVWKNTASSNGTLAYSTTGTNRGTASGTISYSSSYAKATPDSNTTAGICYGNGSKNGVLAYVVEKSAQATCVETAQKR